MFHLRKKALNEEYRIDENERRKKKNQEIEILQSNYKDKVVGLGWNQ